MFEREGGGQEREKKKLFQCNGQEQDNWGMKKAGDTEEGKRKKSTS